MIDTEHMAEPIWRCGGCGFWLPREPDQPAPSCHWCQYDELVRRRGSVRGRPPRALMHEAMRAPPVVEQAAMVE
jgi:hypothetical protein